MKINRKVIFYFGIAAILPVIYYTSVAVYEGQYVLWSPHFFIHILKDLFISYVITVVICAGVMYSLDWVNKIFPWQKGPWKRFMADVLLTPMVAGGMMYPIAHLTYLIYHTHGTWDQHLLKNMVIAVIMDLLLVAIYEGIYFFKQWKISLIKTERLEKENIESRFEALKNQINPHFLFNCLNTLSSLIHEDVDKSERFIDEFSKIYRYVLDNQSNIVVPLKKESEFIQSFLFLQKIRFGENLQVDLKLDSTKLNDFLPTLSLQLLVENAIKHNKVTKSNPLNIQIYLEEDYLIVKNNLQLRGQNGHSTGIGLQNLIERYSVMTDRKPEFFNTGDAYIAKIPLIESD